MLILNKQLALERMISLADRLREAVPEPFVAVPPGSFVAAIATSAPDHAGERMPQWSAVPATVT